METRKLVLDDIDHFVRYFVIAVSILRSNEPNNAQDVAELLPIRNRSLLSKWAANKNQDKDAVEVMSCQMNMIASLHQLCTMRKVTAKQQLSENEIRDNEFRIKKMNKISENRDSDIIPLRDVLALNNCMVIVSMACQCLSMPEQYQNIAPIIASAEAILNECRNTFLISDAIEIRSIQTIIVLIMTRLKDRLVQ